jgi:hypothetical protein
VWPRLGDNAAQQAPGKNRGTALRRREGRGDTKRGERRDASNGVKLVTPHWSARHKHAFVIVFARVIIARPGQITGGVGSTEAAV